jgi:hypothetical protein
MRLNTSARSINAGQSEPAAVVGFWHKAVEQWRMVPDYLKVRTRVLLDGASEAPWRKLKRKGIEFIEGGVRLH